MDMVLYYTQSFSLWKMPQGCGKGTGLQETAVMVQCCGCRCRVSGIVWRDQRQRQGLNECGQMVSGHGDPGSSVR